MEILFTKTKILHSRRVFCNNDDANIITQINFNDLEKGYELFSKNADKKKDTSYLGLYT